MHASPAPSYLVALLFLLLPPAATADPCRLLLPLSPCPRLLLLPPCYSLASAWRRSYPRSTGRCCWRGWCGSRRCAPCVCVGVGVCVVGRGETQGERVNAAGVRYGVQCVHVCGDGIVHSCPIWCLFKSTRKTLRKDSVCDAAKRRCVCVCVCVCVDAHIHQSHESTHALPLHHPAIT